MKKEYVKDYECWTFRADLYNPRFETVKSVVNAINYICSREEFMGVQLTEEEPTLYFSEEKFARYALELLEANGCPTDKHVVKIVVQKKLTPFA